MPRRDGTGPNGLGQMTGRVMGYCPGYSIAGFKRGLGRFGGGNRGDGRGRGFRNRDYPNVRIIPQNLTAEQEANTLKIQATLMQNDLNALNQRIQELEKLEAEKENLKK